MRIKVGKYDLLESGTVVGNANEPIDFFFEDSSLKVLRINFIEKSENDKYVFAEKYNEIGIQLNFQNSISPLGSGNIIPLFIGQHKNKELYFNYRLYPLEKGGSVIHFSFLTGKEVTNG